MTEKFIIIGSYEMDLESKVITLAVFEGEHKWDIRGNKSIRYIDILPEDWREGDKLKDVAYRVYDTGAGRSIL